MLFHVFWAFVYQVRLIKGSGSRAFLWDKHRFIRIADQVRNDVCDETVRHQRMRLKMSALLFMMRVSQQCRSRTC